MTCESCISIEGGQISAVLKDRTCDHATENKAYEDPVNRIGRNQVDRYSEGSPQCTRGSTANCIAPAPIFRSLADYRLSQITPLVNQPRPYHDAKKREPQEKDPGRADVP